MTCHESFLSPEPSRKVGGKSTPHHPSSLVHDMGLRYAFGVSSSYQESGEYMAHGFLRVSFGSGKGKSISE